MKYILGGGISGLIAAFYNPKYEILTKNLGGQMAVRNTGPRLLEVDNYSKQFLHDLGYKKVEIKEAKIGYLYNDSLKNICDEKHRAMYYRKSRCLDESVEVPSSSMSDGKNIIRYYDIDWNEIIEKLKYLIKHRFKYGVLSSININTGLIHLNQSDLPYSTPIDFERIISTIPAPEFNLMSYSKSCINFSSVHKYFIIIKFQEKKFIDSIMGDFDYVYLPEDKFQENRYTRLEKGICLEYTSSCKPFFWDKGLEQYVIYNAQIQNKVTINEISNPAFNVEIKFLGRYAEWNHDIKVNDVIKKSIELSSGGIM